MRRCKDSRDLLDHFKKCKLPECLKCDPTRELLQNKKREQRETEQQSRMLIWIGHGARSAFDLGCRVTQLDMTGVMQSNAGGTCSAMVFLIIEPIHEF